MAHLYIIARGILKDLHEWEHDLSSVFCKYRMKDPKQLGISGTAISDGIVRTQVRPVQLYEIVVPEEAIPDILGIILPNGPTLPYGMSKNMDKKRKKEHGFLTKYTEYLRRFLGLEKLPETWKKTDSVHTLMVNSNSIGIHPIGIKKDRRDIDGIEEI